MPKVALMQTRAESIISDYSKLLAEIKFERILDKKAKTIIKLNLSWTKYFPACSTEPWQLDGILGALAKKYNCIAVENQTVVTHPWIGAHDNKWLPVLKRHGVDFRPLPDEKWVSYKPKSAMLAMNELFPEILVPKMFFGSNIVHLPTMKTHGHTVTTGAMKNAFGGLIPKYRHHAHRKIDEVLVDLLSIQKEIHKGILCAMDGTVCGNGAGPRTMVPFSGNIILASDDQVAADAVAAKIMGFDPMKIKYLKLAHDLGLGCADIDEVDILGIRRDKFESMNFNFRTKKSLIIQWDQIIRKKTAKMHGLHKFLFHSPFFHSFVFASEFYHDRLWYPAIGKHRIGTFSKTQWGQLFERYESGPMPNYNDQKNWNSY
jgi:uncharacterized protein (DUF362 family)